MDERVTHHEMLQQLLGSEREMDLRILEKRYRQHRNDLQERLDAEIARLETEYELAVARLYHAIAHKAAAQPGE